MRILLVEPSRIGRTMVTRMLAEGGHEAVCADNPETALATLEQDPSIDVLMTAIEFVGMSGLELCWSARLLAGSARPLFIVVMSASTDERKLEEALDSGADEFVCKPPRKSELLARLRSAGRMLEAQRELIWMASFDSLTGLRNRRAFFEAVAQEEESSDAISVLALDIDHFKQVNDRHGHDGGDAVLREVARRLRNVDTHFARVGGEEFALLVRGPLERAGELAEMARREVALLPVTLPDCEITITVSVGVAEREPGRSLDSALKDADIALYASKSGGRNRVTLARVVGETAVLEDGDSCAA